MNFIEAYDAVLATWPVPAEPLDVPSAYGTTHVNACGPADGPPLVLLHSGGATSTVWFNNVGDLARTHRVYAVDLINDAGRSVPDGRPVRSREDLMGWLDAVCTGLGLATTALCGHSYGGWIALSYALHAPARISRLALLDPTLCFAGMALTYRLHAIPLFARPTPERIRAFYRWETGGVPLDPTWLELAGRTAEVPRRKIVMPHRPAPDRLLALRVPTVVLVAEKTRAHDPARVAANAKALLPDVTTAVLPGATHHTIPMVDAARLNGALTRFLGG
ncbi:MAG: alpha/beta hydrolase [Actinobacteria bacterium]|nr:MAG: alpha/beta hydrolase [Actinomycetota bacterium]